jgi:hypothetical protein
LLIAKHPANFSPAGGAKWQGFVYGGGPVRVMAGSIIDYGPMGTAGYQAVINRILPLRDLNPRFDHPLVRTALRAVMWLAPRLRAWARNRSLRPEREHPPADSPPLPQAEQSGDGHDLTNTPAREFGIDGPAREQLLQRLLAAGWQAGGPTDLWDATQHGCRVLLATEHGDDGRKHTLVRVWGRYQERWRGLDAGRMTMCGESRMPRKAGPSFLGRAFRDPLACAPGGSAPPFRAFITTMSC